MVLYEVLYEVRLARRHFTVIHGQLSINKGYRKNKLPMPKFYIMHILLRLMFTHALVKIHVNCELYFHWQIILSLTLLPNSR